MRLSAYLIANGWRPGPTIHVEPAFEHRRLSLIPVGLSSAHNLYSPGEARFPLSVAVIVQSVRDRAIEDREARTWART